MSVLQKESKEKIYILPDPDKVPTIPTKTKITDTSSFSEIVKSFIYWTSVTCPYPHEKKIYREDIERLNLKEDLHGNFFTLVLNPDNTIPNTMFTSHLDTADSGEPKKVEHEFYLCNKTQDLYVGTKNTILGGDCKAGVVLMEHMIQNNIPGIYYFFIGEERGLVGSRALSKEWKQEKAINNYFWLQSKEINGVEIKIQILPTKCISFDRKACTSIITHQSGNKCVSDDFTNALSKAFAETSQKLEFKGDSGGSYTDSYAFLDIIPECTNLSVGYSSQHSVYEEQNLTFLDKLAIAVLEVNWESLPASRVPSPATSGKYASGYYGGNTYNLTKSVTKQSNYTDHYADAEYWYDKEGDYAEGWPTTEANSTKIKASKIKKNKYNLTKLEDLFTDLIEDSEGERLVEMVQKNPEGFIEALTLLTGKNKKELSDFIAENLAKFIYAEYGI